MEQYNGSTTHRITITEPPNRAFRFLMGCAILYAVWRCREQLADFLTWRILNAFEATPAALEATTVTGTVLPLLIEFVIGLGGVGIFVFSLGWSVVVDLFAGAVATVAAFRQRMTATNAATAAATAAATSAATNAAGARVAITDPQLLEFARLVQNTFREQRAELKQLTAAVQAMQQPAAATAPAPKRTRAKRTTNGGQT